MENDINKILSTKRDWRKSERRKSERRVKDGTIEERKDTADVLRSGKIPMPSNGDRAESTFINDFIFIFITLIIIMLIIMCTVKPAHADDCQDPGLKPNLKKACYQMEKVCQEIGCTVSIR